MNLDDLTKYLRACRADANCAERDRRVDPDLATILGLQDAIAEYVAADGAASAAGVYVGCRNDGAQAAYKRLLVAGDALHAIAEAR